MLTVDGVPFQGPVVYTGAADELFGRRFGPLPYPHPGLPVRDPGPDLVPEPGHSELHRGPALHPHHRIQAHDGPGAGGQDHYREGVLRAYTGAPEETPYYAIINGENNALYARYRALAERFPNLHLLGRLAEYKYYNMDAIVARALELAGQLI